MAETRLCVGVITGAHGVRGLVRIKSFTEAPENLAAYGKLSDEAGTRSFEVSVTGRAKGALLARIEGVTDRDQAEALRGTRLHIARDALPPLEDEEEYYVADLIGLEAVDRAGNPLGEVRAVHNFGAGDVIEVTPGAEAGGGPSRLWPFTRKTVPEVDLAAGRLVIEPPEELEVGPPEGEKDEGTGRRRKARRPGPDAGMGS